MAKLTKSRARKPLAEGGVSFGGSGNSHTGNSYSATFKFEIDEEHSTYYTAKFDAAEALRFVDIIAGMETHEAFVNGFYNVDRRTTVEKLRALADKIEREAK